MRIHEASLAGTDAQVVLLGVDGGQHDINGTRMDHHPTATIWSFVSSFRRQADGAIEHLGHPHLSDGFRLPAP